MLKVRFRNSKELSKVCSAIDRILNKSIDASQLKCVKLYKKGDKLNIFAMSKNMKINYIVEDTLNIEGDFILFEFKRFLPLLGVMEDIIDINNEVIKNDKCRYKIPSAGTDYPEFEMPKIVYEGEMESEKLRDAINNVMPGTAIGDGVLSGVYINKNEIVSCDSSRMFTEEIKETELDVILPKELANEVLRLPFGDKILIGTCRGKIFFEDKNIMLMGGIIDKDYPDYQKALPTSKNYTICINSEDFRGALELLAPVINSSVPICVLNISKNKIILTAENNSSTAETEVKIKSDVTEDITIKFSFNYLQDMLKVNSGEIVITTYGGHFGYMFESKLSKSRQYIMPVI